MPHKWRQGAYDDDDDDYGDYDDDYDYEEHTEEQPKSTSLAAGGNGYNSLTDEPIEQLGLSGVGNQSMEEETWSCQICTFDNPLDSLTCDICDTPREEACEEHSTAESAAERKGRSEHGSALARALFVPLPGTKSDKASSSSSHKSGAVGFHEKFGIDLANPTSLSSKIVPFKFDTPSPDEKNLSSRGLKKNFNKLTSTSAEVLDTATASMARAGSTKSATSTSVTKTKSTDFASAGFSGTNGEVHAHDREERILNGSLAETSSSKEGELLERMRRMTVGDDHKEGQGKDTSAPSASRKRLPLDSYVPEAWMLKDINKDSRQLLHLIVVGHVDAGKSTLMGRILHLLGRVTQKEMHKNEKESKQQGKGSFAYAFVLDEGAEERARGVTMTVAVAHFETPKLHIVLLDSPGHQDFVPSMISGASQADAAILVVDASIGAFEAGLEGEGQGRGQTREHAQLVRSLGVEQLIVAVNKLDAVDYSKERFDHIKSTLQPFLKQCGYKDGAVQWVPVSAGEGQNLTAAPTEALLTAWYKGPSVVELVDSLEPPVRLIARPLRLIVAEVMKTRTLGASALGGKLESGALQIGTKVRVMPSGVIATVKSIEQEGQPLTKARAGEGVDIGLTGVDPGMLVPGGVLCHPDYPVPVATRFEIRILTLGIRVPILPGSQVVLHAHHAKQPARVAQLVSLLDPKKGTVLRQRPRCLTANQSALVEVVPDEGLCIEEYSEFRALGRVALRDGGKTIAVGIVTRILQTKQLI